MNTVNSSMAILDQAYCMMIFFFKLFREYSILNLGGPYSTDKRGGQTSLPVVPLFQEEKIAWYYYRG